MIKLMISAPSSGSGKTAVTCGMLALFKRKGLRVGALKCGPDYIDPMFHRSVLGIDSHNMDLFFMGKDLAKNQYLKYSADKDAMVIEGAMGCYDGLGGTTSDASAWDTAVCLDLPVILVVNARGAGLSLAAQIKGISEFRVPSMIKGVILNRCSEMLFKSLAETLEKESGVPVLGYLPEMQEAYIESRHLGLYTSGEIKDREERISAIADVLEKSIDLKRLFELCSGDIEEDSNSLENQGHNSERQEKQLKESDRLSGGKIGSLGEIDKIDNLDNLDNLDNRQDKHIEKKTKIAVAYDDAFCFIYRENIELFEELGAEIEYFSPIRDRSLPAGIGALYFPGGYPELFAEELSENESMKADITSKLEAGMPLIAECGGFLYLSDKLKGSDEKYRDMVGFFAGSGESRGRLTRFGYIELTAETDGMLLKKGEKIRAHEFHYWDTDANGDDMSAVKPVSGRSWKCAYNSENIYAGFPHLYLLSCREAAERFVDKAYAYSGEEK